MNTFTGYATALNVTTTTTGTSGSLSTVDGVFPGTSVSVYTTGTSVLATIYQADQVTARANPFLVNIDASFTFYGANSSYDLVFSDPLSPSDDDSSTTPTPSGSSGLAFFNVVDYGAVGDNVTDDSAAFQDAIDACAAASGSTVFIPYGTYLIASQLLISQNCIDFIGSGRETILHFTGGASALIRVAAGNVRLADFLAYGSDQAGEIGIHLSIDGNVQNLIEHVVLREFRIGIKVLMFDQTIRDCEIDMTSSNGQIGIYVGHNSNATIIEACEIQGRIPIGANTSIGIVVTDNVQTRITGNRIQYHRGGNIILDNRDGNAPQSTYIGYNYFESTETNNLDIDLANSTIHTVIEGNYHNANSTANYCVRIGASTTNTQLLSNRYTQFANSAIHNLGGSGIILRGNTRLAGQILDSFTGVVEYTGTETGVAYKIGTDQLALGTSTGKMSAYGAPLVDQPTLSTGSGVTPDGIIATLQTLGWVKQSGVVGTPQSGVRVYNVMDYGAIGNNIADDAAAFALAILAASATHDGGVVYVPPSRYKIGTGLSIAHSQVYLCGSARGSWIYWTGGGSACITFATGVTDCMVSDLLMVGTNVASEVGILMGGGANVGNTIERVTSYTMKTHIKVGDGATVTLDTTIRDCDLVIGAGPQVGIDVTSACRNVVIDNCQIRGFAGNGGSVSDTSTGVSIAAATGVLIRGGNIEGVASSNVKITGAARNVVIDGVQLQAWGSGGLDVSIGATAVGVTVTNCIMTDDTTPSDYSMLITDGAKAVRIVNNNMTGVGTACVHNLNTAAIATARLGASGNQHTGTFWSATTGVAFDEDPTNSWTKVGEALFVGNLTSGKVPIATTGGQLINSTIAAPSSARANAQTAANTNVLTVAVGAADATYELWANVLVTTSTLHSFGVTVDYTDEGNTARTLTIPFAQLAGTLITAITNATGAGPYEGVALTIRTKASTSIVFKTAGTFTTVVYNVDCSTIQVA